MKSRILAGLMVAWLIAAAGCSGDDAETTSSTTTTTTQVTSTVGSTSTTSTTVTTTTSTTSTTVAPPVTNPPVQAGYPDNANAIAVLLDIDQLGIVGGDEPVWWWNAFAQDEPQYLAGYLELTVAPDGSVWATRDNLQTEKCTPLIMDVVQFTGPNEIADRFAVSTVNQPNCRPQEIKWPAGYLSSIAATPQGLLLLYQDQFPRDNCELGACVPDKVVFAELRPYGALNDTGEQIQVYRQPLDIEDRDAEAQALIPFPGAWVSGQSVDGAVVALRFDNGTGALLDTATMDLSPAPAYAIPTHDGAGYLYATVGGEFPEITGTLTEARPGTPERDVFVNAGTAVIPFADMPGHTVIGLTSFEVVELYVFDKTEGRLYFTGIQGIPGPHLARVVPAN